MDVEDDESGMTLLHLPQDLPGSVRGTVIDHDNLQVGIVLGQQGGQGRSNGLRLIAGRDNDGDQGAIRCRSRTLSPRLPSLRLPRAMSRVSQPMMIKR